MGLVSFFNDAASEMLYPIVPIFLTSILGAPASVVGLIEGIAEEKQAEEAAKALVGEKYCHPVPDYVFGKFGTVALNETRSESWVGAFITKAVGGYGYSGWIWETVDGKFRIKQGPKLLSLETSQE